MLWLAVHLPWLSLEAYCASLPAVQREGAVALVAEHRITAANASAERLGIKPGIKRATALALAPKLQLGQADESRDAQALQALSHVALAYTPAVALDGDSVVLLEVQSCLRYFGGATELLARLRESLAPLGHRVQIASAPTALGAALLARWRDDLAWGSHSRQLGALQALLDDVPVWLLGRGQAHWEALQGMGLRRLSDLRHLPRSGLARRFGEELLEDLDRARGQRADPRTWIAAPQQFSSRLELAMRADSAEQVLHGASVLLARLVAWAQARQARIEAFALRLLHEPLHRSGDAESPATTLRIELAEPSLDARHLQLLLRERLARLSLPAPTLELQIDCSELSETPSPNGELFPSRPSGGAGLLRLLEHLRARLGDDQVQRLQPVPDHRPEHACRSVPVFASARTPLPALPAARQLSLPLAHPVWLLPEPLALQEQRAKPMFEGRPLQLLSGPERIEAGWWDGSLVTRDYYIARDSDGSLVWVYRTRLPQKNQRQPVWFLHGRFG